MKNITSTLLIGLSALVLSNPLVAQKTLTVKPDASKVEWFAEKVTGAHNGLVSLKSGTIEVNNERMTGGSFTIDMTTINTTDLDGGSKKKLDGHLMSKDFFNVSEFETADFKITKVEALKSDDGFNQTITGDLTIKGITNEVSFPASVKMTEGKLAAYGEMTVDRTKFDIKYGSASFFESIGDKAIMDEFVLKISLGAKI